MSIGAIAYKAGIADVSEDIADIGAIRIYVFGAPERDIEYADLSPVVIVSHSKEAAYEIFLKSPSFTHWSKLLSIIPLHQLRDGLIIAQ